MIVNSMANSDFDYIIDFAFITLTIRKTLPEKISERIASIIR